jgi:hypothetical protein
MQKGKVVINTVMIDLDNVKSFRNVQRPNKTESFCTDAGIEFKFIDGSKPYIIWWFQSFSMFSGCDTSNFNERNKTYEKLLNTFDIREF